MLSPRILQRREELCQPPKPNSNPGSFSYQLCESEPLVPRFEWTIVRCSSVLYEFEFDKLKRCNMEILTQSHLSTNLEMMSSPKFETFAKN